MAQFQIYLEAIEKALQNEMFFPLLNKQLEKQEEMFLKKEKLLKINSSPNITSEESNFFMDYLANAMQKKGIKNMDEALGKFLDKESDFYKTYNNKKFEDILNKFKQNGYVKEKKGDHMYFYFLKNNIFYYLSIKHYEYRENIIMKFIAFSVISTASGLREKEGSFGRISTPDSSSIFNMIFSIIEKEIPEYEKIIFSFEGNAEFKEMERVEKGYPTMRTRLYVAVLRNYFGEDIEINQSGRNIYFSKRPIPIGKPLEKRKSGVVSK